MIIMYLCQVYHLFVMIIMYLCYEYYSQTRQKIHQRQMTFHLIPIVVKQIYLFLLFFFFHMRRPRYLPISCLGIRSRSNSPSCRRRRRPQWGPRLRKKKLQVDRETTTNLRAIDLKLFRAISRSIARLQVYTSKQRASQLASQLVRWMASSGL